MGLWIDGAPRRRCTNAGHLGNRQTESNSGFGVGAQGAETPCSSALCSLHPVRHKVLVTVSLDQMLTSGLTRRIQSRARNTIGQDVREQSAPELHRVALRSRLRWPLDRRYA